LCRHALASLYVRQGHWPEATGLVRDWLAREPQRAAAYAEEGWLWRQAGDLPRAQARLQQALELDPHDPRALTELAQAYEDLQQSVQESEIEPLPLELRTVETQAATDVHAAEYRHHLKLVGGDDSPAARTRSMTVHGHLTPGRVRSEETSDRFGRTRLPIRSRASTGHEIVIPGEVPLSTAQVMPNRNTTWVAPPVQRQVQKDIVGCSTQ